MTKLDKMKVPKNKTDFESLNDITKEEIILHQDLLLEWLEDINWPVSAKVLEVLKPFVIEIEAGILKILKGDDPEWKCNIILHLLCNAEEVSPLIISEVKEIYKHHSELLELKEVCEVFFKKFEIKY